MNLDQLIRKKTDSELFYLNHPGQLSASYHNIKKVKKKNKDVYLFELPQLHEKEIMIRKDSRFTAVPDYIHSNININYIYSGKCTYIIDDHEVELFKGDVCIFDKHVIRSKKRIGEDDIIINISIDYSYFKKILLNEIGKDNIILDFLINAIVDTSNHDNYLIFRTNNAVKIENLFKALLIEYHQDLSYQKDAMFSYLLLIFFELLRLYDSHSNKQLIQVSHQTNNDCIAILQYIDTHYKDCTLNELAEKFSYHPKYLSSLIKKSTNRTFKQIQNRRRIMESARLLKTTTLSVEQIATTVGYTNISSFYRYFNNLYGYTPTNYRKLEQKKHAIDPF